MSGGRTVDPAPTTIGATDPDVPLRAADNPVVLRRHGRAWVAVASYVVTVFVLITLNFALPRLMPGDPIDALMTQGNPSFAERRGLREALLEYYNLDASIPEQYVNYLARLAQGDFGVSITSNTPVGPELLSRAGWSFLLIGTATVVSMLIGIPAGVHSGWKRGKRLDRGLLAFFLGWSNLPIFILGSVGFVLFAAQLGIFPLGGSITPFSGYTGFANIVDIGRHLFLPALLMGLDLATFQYMIMRSSMVNELGSDYLLGGRAKGLLERRLKYRYVGRNALLPVVTVIGLQAGGAITSTIFIERIFSYPGVGGYLVGAVGNRDYPALQGAFLLLTITVLTVNLGVDLLYRRLDPRTAR